MSGIPFVQGMINHLLCNTIISTGDNRIFRIGFFIVPLFFEGLQDTAPPVSQFLLQLLQWQVDHQR